MRLLRPFFILIACVTFAGVARGQIFEDHSISLMDADTLTFVPLHYTESKAASFIAPVGGDEPDTFSFFLLYHLAESEYDDSLRFALAEKNRVRYFSLGQSSGCSSSSMAYSRLVQWGRKSYLILLNSRSAGRYRITEGGGCGDSQTWIIDLQNMTVLDLSTYVMEENYWREYPDEKEDTEEPGEPEETESTDTPDELSEDPDEKPGTDIRRFYERRLVIAFGPENLVFMTEVVQILYVQEVFSKCYQLRKNQLIRKPLN